MLLFGHQTSQLSSEMLMFRAKLEVVTVASFAIAFEGMVQQVMLTRKFYYGPTSKYNCRAPHAPCSL